MSTLPDAAFDCPTPVIKCTAPELTPTPLANTRAPPVSVESLALMLNEPLRSAEEPVEMEMSAIPPDKEFPVVRLIAPLAAADKPVVKFTAPDTPPGESLEPNVTSPLLTVPVPDNIFKDPPV